VHEEDKNDYHLENKNKINIQKKKNNQEKRGRMKKDKKI